MTDTSRDHRKACIYALITALMWSTIATAFKIALVDLDPWQLLFWSVITSTLFLLGLTAYQKKIPLIAKQFKQSPLFFIGLGVLNPFLYHLTLFGAYDLLPAQQAQAVNYSWPIALTLLSIPLMGRKLSFTGLSCCLLTYSGVLLICAKGDLSNLDLSTGATNLTGLALALVSTILWALYWIVNAKYKSDPIIALLLCSLCGLPLVIVSTLYFSTLWSGWSNSLAAAVYIGLVEMGIIYVLWLKALKLTTNTAQVSNLSYLSPFLSLIFIANILGEPIYPTTYLGLIIIISSVLAQQYFSRQQVKK